MAELLEVGAKEARFMDMLPDPLKAGYKEAPLDRDLSILISRRATFEMGASGARGAAGRGRDSERRFGERARLQPRGGPSQRSGGER